MDDLDDELARRQAPQDFLADRLLLDFVNEVLDDLVVDVGVEEYPSDFVSDSATFVSEIFLSRRSFLKTIFSF